MSGDSEDDGDLAVISESEWGIQERTRERMAAMRESHSANDVLQDGEGEARDGASLDWDIATSDSMESVSDKLGAQQAARDERGAHHMGSPVVPLLPSPEDAQLAGCGRLIRDAGCEWIEQMVRDGVIRPKVESGSRVTLEVVPSGVSVSVDLSKGEAAFSAGEREFADANEMEAWLRSA